MTSTQGTVIMTTNKDNAEHRTEAGTRYRRLLMHSFNSKKYKWGNQTGDVSDG